jgi:membrane associated rhomboid family serine protease
VAPALVLLSMLAFVWLATQDAEPRNQFLRQWGAVPETLFPQGATLWDGVDARMLNLLSALFIHADWLHLVGNMLFLVIFGLPAERALGPWRFLLTSFIRKYRKKRRNRLY